MNSKNLDDKQRRLLQGMLKFSTISTDQSQSAVQMQQSEELSLQRADERTTHKNDSKGNSSTASKAGGKVKPNGPTQAQMQAQAQTPKKDGGNPDTHFSSSAFLSSPDPSALPLPQFDEMT
mmetsp:Transcript_12928/g.28736  ORF Transcript_12928/g.28736 Transcript_12928/m.28736 type:complete len:121 (+) Transcript_12928:78-440(+)|eukprot:CAMPEP_0173187700 /NCGR_PEP_ID=MMETSP1141-20130122/10854_1 /TAXON_ID=483371 /ORGANISM="non described non described, Strain CCMP2298" /LENGTH=120 /DNA_ID=CAMNT_0014111565 /DNA_START=19 /DNA_END=381 /DNA_ORIENTATION=-